MIRFSRELCVEEGSAGASLEVSQQGLLPVECCNAATAGPINLRNKRVDIEEWLQECCGKINEAVTLSCLPLFSLPFWLCLRQDYYSCCATCVNKLFAAL